MSTLHAVILAAGRGTRMKSDLPKVLHTICGRPMIAYALDLAATSGVKQPIVVLGQEADAVREHLPKEVRVVIQEKALGTGDAVLAAKRTLGAPTGDVLILYADTPLVRRTTIQRLIETHRKTRSTCTLLTAHLADPSGYGRVVRDPAGIVTGVVEEAEANAVQRAIREINVGPLIVQAAPLFEALAQVGPSKAGKEWYLTEVISILSKREGTKFQAVRVEKATEAIGVNSRIDLSKATAIVRQRIVESHMNNGVTIIDPLVTYIDQGVTIGQDTTIYPGTYIESGVTIGKRCSIGPHARLRTGVAIGDDSRVGNFAELVRTKLGAKVRMNHVSYLGDTTVEDDVNIGAGTITANFDGKNKLPTVIGKGAFIGCDTVLIAPVKVGAGAVTGAGSVVPKGHDVAAQGTVVGVPARPLEGASKKDGRATPPEPVEAPARVRNGRSSPKPAAKRRPVARAVATASRAKVATGKRRARR